MRNRDGNHLRITAPISYWINIITKLFKNLEGTEVKRIYDLFSWLRSDPPSRSKSNDIIVLLESGSQTSASEITRFC